MADNNKCAVTAPCPVGQPGEEQIGGEGIDDEDPFSENQDCVEETLFIGLTAPPENQLDMNPKEDVAMKAVAMCNLEWYHGRLGRQTAEDRLRTAGETGSYLVRESERNKGSYALSYLGKNGLTHFKMSSICGDYYIGGRRFDSLSLLVGYYTSCSYLLKGEQLKFPVSPPEPVDDRRKVVAVYPFSKMPETDELSFQKGDIFIVLNEMGDGWLWVKSQRTNEDGQIHEALVDDLNGNVDPVQSLSYFHANITKEVAVEKLREAGQGSFLVRPSENSPGNYSLFVLCEKTVQRFRIETQGKQLYFMGGRYFDSLDGIVERYKKEEIVEGFTLVKPVNRETKEKLDRLSHKGSAEDLVDTIRQSSRGPMTGRTKKNVMTGFLHIKKSSQKTKKWKNMFFVLLGQDRQLCYLENEKRSRPKGLIDMSYSSLYLVHDSFFGRPNCFQLITNANAYNHFQIYYLCAENGDLAQKWIQALKPYCVNTTPVRSQQRSSVLKELRTLTVEVVDARQLPTKLLNHPYCVVSLNNVRVCKTQTEEGANPVWEEKFILDDVPCDIESFSVSLYNQSRRSIDKEIAAVMVPLDDLRGVDCLDKWFPLQPANSTIRGEVGSLRIRARYLHEIIMPEDKYSTLKELILNGDLSNILDLFNICGNDRIPLAKALLQIFRHEKQEKVILKTMNDFEIAREEEVSTLFRATSLATTLMDQYMKMTASYFVSVAVKDCILRILECKQSCELNPTLLEGGDMASNRDHFMNFLFEMVESIFKSGKSCPPVLRYICGCLQKSVTVRWPSDDSVKTRVVSGFIFLRLLCPAILNPKSFNLITETPSEMASRTLKLIAKALQNLANLVEFGAKESFMEVINPFIKKYKPRMVQFLDELSNDEDSENQENEHTAPVDDLARDLATIHQICASHLTELRKRGETKNSLKKLVAVTEILTDHKKRYMT